MSDKWDGWACIPGRICGGSGFMRETADEIERLQGLLREARDSVRKHWRGHVKGLERAIRLDRIDVIAIETKREAELRDLRDRIDAALGAANQPKESK